MLCGKEEESTHHLLGECSFVKITLRWIFKWYGITINHFGKVKDLVEFAAKLGNCSKKKKKSYWECATELLGALGKLKITVFSMS